MEYREISQKIIYEISQNYGTIDVGVFGKRLRLTMGNFEYLKGIHAYEISFLENRQLWTTRVPDDTKKERSRKLTAKSIEGLLSKLMGFYGVSESSVDVIYRRWLNGKKEIAKIKDAEHKTSLQTLNRNDRAYNSYFNEFKKRDIKTITEGDIDDFISQLKRPNGKPIGQSDYRIVRTLLRNIFRYAHKRGLTDINIGTVLQDIEPPAIAKKEKAADNSGESFNSTEKMRIINYLASSDRMTDLAILLTFATGERVSEISALELRDIHEDYITVSKTESFIQEDGHIIFFIEDTTKTEAGIRKPVIRDKDLWILEKIKSIGNSDRKYAFEENGRRIHSPQIRDRLKSVLRILGIHYRSPHKIRKTYASELHEAGLPDGFIQQQMGHKDIQTTLAFYVKPNYTEEEKRAYINSVH